MSYLFKAYVSGGRECFEWRSDQNYAFAQTTQKRDFEFSQSLLDFLYLEIEKFRDDFARMGEAVRKLEGQPEGKRDVPLALLNGLSNLAEKHIYFRFLCLDWLDRLDRYVKGEKIVLRYKDLTHVPSDILTMQQGLQVIFSKALSAMSLDQPMQHKMARLYETSSASPGKCFEFTAVTACYERVGVDSFTEVLHPKNIGDFVSFFLGELVRRELAFKTCKSCGKYFPLSGHGNSEYCNRLFQGTSKTCKEIGASKVYMAKVEENPAFKLYNRAYKTQFARIKYRRLTKPQFQVWAEQARELRDKVVAGEINLAEYERWLQN